MRAIFEFGKRGRLSYISHLDLQRFMMRAVRRTDLPVSYSQGFNPHPHMSFASALAMGWSSDVELMDIRMTQDVDPEHALEQMRAALPPEMPVYRCRAVSDRFPALMSMLVMADYTITFEGNDISKVMDAAAWYQKADTVMAIRKTKSSEKEINIRALTLSLLPSDESTLKARLMLTPEDTLKPDLLAQTLVDKAVCADEMLFRIHRDALLGYNAHGDVVPLWDIEDR